MSPMKFLVSLMAFGCLIAQANCSPVDPYCGGCQFVVKIIKPHCNKDTFEGFLFNRCEAYFKTRARVNQCKEYVEQHLDQMFQETPLEICKFLEACK